MDQKKTIDLQKSYDRVAEQYVERIFNELEHKPFDRALLDRFAESVKGTGLACDLGCGPGQIARYLRSRGVNVFGIDLSPRMVEQAQRLNPGIEFKQGNMLSLDLDDNLLGGIAAFYSIIHIPRKEMTQALGELNRVLRPEGILLLAFHIGQETIHLDEWWGEEVAVDFTFFNTDEVVDYLKSAGFEIETIAERPPYENIEHQSQRGYIFARKPRTAAF
jgi:SAM-dependent methyltransferase